MSNQDKNLQPPYSVYLAPAATADPEFAYTGDGSSGNPLVLSDPPAAYEILGTYGADDAGEITGEGIKFMMARDIEHQEPALNEVFSNRSYLKKVEYMISFAFRDFNAAALGKVMGASVTTEAAAAASFGESVIDLDVGLEIPNYTLLVRAYGTTEAGQKWPRQLWMPRVINRNDVDFTMSKTDASTPTDWYIHKDPSLGVGNMRWADVADTE